VVATGRRPADVTGIFGTRDDLLSIRLDVTSVDDADAAVRGAAVERFRSCRWWPSTTPGRRSRGYFEEMSPRQVGAAAGDEPWSGPMTSLERCCP